MSFKRRKNKAHLLFLGQGLAFRADFFSWKDFNFYAALAAW